jgi:hypothetical protein
MLRWLAAALLLAGAAQARTLSVGPGQEFRFPSLAAEAAQDGDRIEIHPGRYRDCAIWRANRLVITGTALADATVIGSKICEAKAIFVTKGDNITVRNLTLTRATVQWGNAAGIRGEGRELTVDGVRFVNNENGILTGVRDGGMYVRNSLFDGNGSCRGPCAHGIYASGLDLLRVEHSRFIRTQQGHHIKSRAKRTEVLDNSIQDGPEGTASYEIEAPVGGSVLIRGNTIEKGPRTENKSTAISIGAEGTSNPTPEIVIENNRFRNDSPEPTTFVTNLTRTPAILRGNVLHGAVTPLSGPGEVVAP